MRPDMKEEPACVTQQDEGSDPSSATSGWVGPVDYRVSPPASLPLLPPEGP